ncbi:MAG: methyl-accepting chemotaxis protein [Betaproteobacteria bacterium]|nr:methyl-accepting chemotaxis protein [Betaproteobacteria bacterium]
MSLRNFRDWSISTKLNVVQVAATLGLFAAAIIALNIWLGSVLEKEGVKQLQGANQLAVSMVETVRISLENAVSQLGAVLARKQDFSGAYVLHEDETVEVGGAKTPVLSLNGKTLNGDNAPLDEFTTTTAAPVTIFARRGDDFVRIATSLKKEDGSRALGTPMGEKHPARELLLAGKPYVGKAHLFGRDYMTSYQPMRDQAGKVVGVLFVGLDFTDQLADLKKRLLAVKLFQTGYIYAVDAGANKGMMVVHPTREGSSLWDAQDSDGLYFMREIVEKKDGVISYRFPKPNETAESRKIAVFASLPEWNWVIASSVYDDEFKEGTNVALIRDRLIIGAALLCALLSVIVFFSTRHWVARPLDEVVGAMRRIAKGDLTVAVEQHNNDEVGQLLYATNTMVTDMRTTLGDIQSAAFQLAENAGNLSGSAMRVAAQSGAQSDAAATMAASIEEMSANIGNVAEDANRANAISMESGEVSSRSAEVIEQAVSSMARIAETVHATSTAVTALGQESQAISAIVKVIREIADQTNLLALNAAIEAARAGEQGRGFAVVADEVRKLSERTSASTQEISTLIDRILRGTEEAVTGMDSGVSQVKEGMVYAEQAGASIVNIRDSASRVIASVTSISHALEKQTAATTEIATNVDKIANMADDSNVMAKKSAEQAGELEKLAESLRARVAHFTI